MTKNYFHIVLFIGFIFVTIKTVAQESKQPPAVQNNTSIEGLKLYPNPVTNGKVNIISKNNLEKEITIFDVLGKKVLQTRISTKELNISNLVPSVYIIKITEGNDSCSLKLIVR